MSVKRNPEGGTIAPEPGGYQRENAGTFGSGTVPMVEALWACGLCDCAQVRDASGPLTRRICKGTCKCHHSALRRGQA